MKKAIRKRGILKGILILLALAILSHFPVYDTADWVGLNEGYDCAHVEYQQDDMITVKIINTVVDTDICFPLTTWNFDIFIIGKSMLPPYSENQVNWVIGEVQPEHPI